MRRGHHRGWETVELASDTLAATVVPGKGGDVVSLRWLPGDLELLWQSPWGLRARGAVTGLPDDIGTYMDGYPGGWQTVFPNGGDPVVEHGAQWGMHGEVAITPFDDEPAADGALRLHAVLVRSPFEVTKVVAVRGDRLELTETITNRGGEPVEAMWSHHPAFGPPLLDGGCRLEAAARTVVVDDARDTTSGDLQVGGRGSWPAAPGRDGAVVDLSAIPPPGAGIDRMAYLTDFERGWAALTNPGVGVSVELEWDAGLFPHAWYWLEANGQRDFPWYQRAYVLAVEPATSFPGQGLHAVRNKTGNQISFEPGETRETVLGLRVRPA